MNYSFGDIKLYNGDCMEVMKGFKDKSIDLILTSPPYNTNKRAGKQGVLEENETNPVARYDVYVDNLSNDEYVDFTKSLFNEFDRILAVNGCILYNISYGSENPDCMFRAINDIIVHTPFMIADTLVWQKTSALPNNVSPNKMTRICEFIFVFSRKSEYGTFYSNKKVTSYRPTGQPMYENIGNLIFARNNDEVCPYNKATFSTDLCTKLLKMYAKDNAVVYDPFMGSGTTAVACNKLGLRCWGSELSDRQCEWAYNRLCRQDTVEILDFSDYE